MELTHQFVVPTSVEETWTTFNDLAGIAPCFPGATLNSVDGDEFTGSVKVKLGPISMLYTGSGQFVERDESARRAVIEAKGKDKRGNGTANASVVATMTPAGAGTSIEVSTDLTITGKPAQFGRGVIQDVSDKLLDQFVECIANKLAPEQQPAASSEQPTSSAAPGAGTGEPSTDEIPPVDRSTAGKTAAGAPGGATATGGAGQETEGLNLVGTVLPVLARRYAVPAAAAVVVTIVVIRALRRR